MLNNILAEEMIVVKIKYYFSCYFVIMYKIGKKEGSWSPVFLKAILRHLLTTNGIRMKKSFQANGTFVEALYGCLKKGFYK